MLPEADFTVQALRAWIRGRLECRWEPLDQDSAALSALVVQVGLDHSLTALAGFIERKNRQFRGFCASVARNQNVYNRLERRPLLDETPKAPFEHYAHHLWNEPRIEDVAPALSELMLVGRQVRQQEHIALADFLPPEAPAAARTAPGASDDDDYPSQRAAYDDWSAKHPDVTMDIREFRRQVGGGAGTHGKKVRVKRSVVDNVRPPRKPR